MTDDFDPSVARSRETYVTGRDWLYVAILLNASLYLVGVFVAGIVIGNHTAWALALVTVGVCYIAPMMQLALPEQRAANLVFVALSIALGIAAGVALLIGG